MEGSFLIPSEDVVCFFFSIIESLQNGPKQKEARTIFFMSFCRAESQVFCTVRSMCTGALQEAYYSGRREAMIDPSESHLEEEMIIMSTTTIFNLEVATVVVVVVPPPPRYSRP